MVVLRLIRLNMGVNTTTEIILDVFNRFKEMDDKLRFSDSTSVSTCSASSESAYQDVGMVKYVTRSSGNSNGKEVAQFSAYNMPSMTSHGNKDAHFSAYNMPSMTNRGKYNSDEKVYPSSIGGFGDDTKPYHSNSNRVDFQGNNKPHHSNVGVYGSSSPLLLMDHSRSGSSLKEMSTDSSRAPSSCSEGAEGVKLPSTRNQFAPAENGKVPSRSEQTSFKHMKEQDKLPHRADGMGSAV